MSKSERQQQIRQAGLERLRQREDRILEAAETDPSLTEVAEQIREHRACGRYTTQG